MAKRLRFSAAAAYRHLRKVDPVIGRLIDEVGPYQPRPGDDPYGQLVRTLLFQQLAGPAASAIMRRWYGFYGDESRTPTPEQILATSDEDFRACGISRQKMGYLRDLAAHVADGRLPFDRLDELSDAEVQEALTAVKGIGEWTAHMMLMFHLGRPDVLPVGDLGVRNGMKAAYGLAEQPTPKEALAIGAKWSPYASVASWYMWQILEVVTPEAVNLQSDGQADKQADKQGGKQKGPWDDFEES